MQTADSMPPKSETKVISMFYDSGEQGRERGRGVRKQFAWKRFQVSSVVGSGSQPNTVISGLCEKVESMHLPGRL